MVFIFATLILSTSDLYLACLVKSYSRYCTFWNCLVYTCPRYNLDISLYLTFVHSFTSWKSMTLLGPPNLPSVSFQSLLEAISGLHRISSWTFAGTLSSIASTIKLPMDGRYL